MAQGRGNGHLVCGDCGAGFGAWHIGALGFAAWRCDYHDGFGGIRDVCGAGEARGGGVRRVDDDRLQPLCRGVDIVATGDAAGVVVGGGGELAGRALGGLGGDFVHGGVWVGGGVFVVLLVATVFGGFAVECVYVLAAGAGDDSGDFDAGEKGSWMELVGGALALGGVYWTESSRASRLAANGASGSGSVSDYACQLNRSTQHLLIS